MVRRLLMGYAQFWADEVRCFPGMRNTSWGICVHPWTPAPRTRRVGAPQRLILSTCDGTSVMADENRYPMRSRSRERVSSVWLLFLLIFS